MFQIRLSVPTSFDNYALLVVQPDDQCGTFGQTDQYRTVRMCNSATEVLVSRTTSKLDIDLPVKGSFAQCPSFTLTHQSLSMWKLIAFFLSLSKSMQKSLKSH